MGTVKELSRYSYIMTRSGKKISYEEGVPELGDLVLGIGRESRFAGQLKSWWSVLQHSIVCRNLAKYDGANTRTYLWALCHDLHEAVTGDIPGPFVPEDIKEFQAELDIRIRQSLGIPHISEEELAIVKYIDTRALFAEGAVLGDWQWAKDRSFNVDEEVVKDVLAAMPDASYTTEEDSLGYEQFMAMFKEDLRMANGES